MRDSYLYFLDYFSGLALRDHPLHGLCDLHQFLDLCLDDPLNLSDLYVSNDLVDFNLFDDFLSAVHCHYFLDLNRNLLGHLDDSLHNDLSGGWNLDELLTFHLERNMLDYLTLHWLLDVDGDFLDGSVYLLLLLFKDNRLGGCHRNSLLEAHGVVNLVLDDNGSLDVPGWGSEHLQDSIYVKVSALLLKHGDEGSVKGEFNSVFLPDAHKFFKKFLEHGLEVEDHLHLFRVVIGIHVIDSHLLYLINYNLLQTFDRSTFDQFDQKLRLEQLGNLARAMGLKLREFHVNSLELSSQDANELPQLGFLPLHFVKPDTGSG